MAGEIQLNSTTFATESGGTVTVSNVDSATNRTNLGLGSIATQAADNVAITGGSLTGTEIDLKSSGTTIYASNGSTAVLSESGGLVTLADTVQHVTPIVVAKRDTTHQGPISSSTFTKVEYNDVVTDTHSFFDATTNYRFLPTIAGYYQINANVGMDADAGSRWIISVYKNGSQFHRLFDYNATANIFKLGGSCLVEFNGSTDYVEIYAYVTSGNTIQFQYIQNETFFNAFLVQRT